VELLIIVACICIILDSRAFHSLLTVVAIVWLFSLLAH